MIKINLEKLRDGLKHVDVEYGSLMAKCAIVCFYTAGYKPHVDVPINVSASNEFEKDGRSSRHNYKYIPCSFFWETLISKEILLSYKDENKTTDFGAMAIALLLTLELTEYNCFVFSEGNNGIDFWLSNDEDELNFMGARLEVSGIREVTKSNTLRTRVKGKMEQSKASDDCCIPAYISVTDFSTPESAFIKRNIFI